MDRNVNPNVITLMATSARMMPPAGLTSGGLANWQLGRVQAHVEQHLDRPIPVAELAAIARLSIRHFARAFARSQGLPPHAYVISRRMARARHLMRTTDLPLSQIALACGACDQAHLSRLFRAECGVSPMRWRQAHGARPQQAPQAAQQQPWTGAA